MCEIRWHGRGGQGAVTSAKFLAQAAYHNGFRGVASAPSFGAERRGAPVTASTRLSSAPLRFFSQVEYPDLVVVLDETLLECNDATEGLREGGWIVINSPREPADMGIKGAFSVATADATAVARELDLTLAGGVIVNTPMLGALARATELVTLDDIRETLVESFRARVAAKNALAAQMTYERTKLAAVQGRQGA
ncbi:MAG TPA: pyruvate oxidoreductase subunit gamma [Candidatus Hydrogenedentes bacterium]|nr:pyruvate oxidoreductase subunit gamma [Candidatus Hydrogenedentota bacterium]